MKFSAEGKGISSSSCSWFSFDTGIIQLVHWCHCIGGEWLLTICLKKKGCVGYVLRQLARQSNWLHLLYMLFVTDFTGEQNFLHFNLRREAEVVWCLLPVWNLRAVIWFHFSISSLVLLPSPITFFVWSFFPPACWSIFLNFFPKILPTFFREEIGFFLYGSCLAARRSKLVGGMYLSLIHIWRCRRDVLCRSRWSPYH